IYVLKDLHTIIEPFFVKVWMNEESVKVQSGILTQRIDNLILKNVENVELTKSPIGRVFGYTTLCLYAYGSWVELPFV
ncbi:PH domain-containing protein, partial [Vibrio parahaemolyticus]|nr:PH domain-containing protein [Vibrio parahaemolyticus]